MTRRSSWRGSASVAVLAAIVAGASHPVFRTPQLSPDDYRYLLAARDLERDFAGNLLEASIVENRWDHLWWIGIEEKVRFFRPAVVLAYASDARLFAPAVKAGLLATNAVLHFACVLLAALAIRRWAGGGLPSVLGSVLFAAFACHDEAIWYVAGRTETLATIGFLGAFLLHAGRAVRRRWFALPLFALALSAKELSIVLPAVCFAHDLLAGRREGGIRETLRTDGALYAGYAAVAAAWLALRAAALGGEESSLVHPYFFSPARPDFLAHLWLQFRIHGESLFLGGHTPSLAPPERAAAQLSPAGLALSLAAVAFLFAGMRKDRTLRAIAAFGFLAWLPTFPVYLSGRSLYLPSVALAGALAVGIARLRGRRLVVGVALASLWTAHQAYRLHAKVEGFSAVRTNESTERRLLERPLALPPGAEAIVLNLPGKFLHPQFAEDQLRWALRDPSLRARVVTAVEPKDFAARPPFFRRDGPNAFVLTEVEGEDGGPGQPVADNTESPFEVPPFEPGRRIRGERLGFEVEILRGEGGRCEEARFVFPRPLEEYVFLDLRVREIAFDPPPK